MSLHSYLRPGAQALRAALLAAALPAALPVAAAANGDGMIAAATATATATAAAATSAASTAATPATSPAAGAVTAARLRPAVMARAAAQSVMLGAARAGKRLVAVGERGVVLLSDDQGKTWRQAAAPVSVTLTAVRFADDKHGVAVGHAGVILVSADGGATWQRVLDGERIATLALAAARAGGSAAAIRDAERLVADGADKPLLDVCLLGAGRDGRILAVGAYGLALTSADGGRTWSSWMDRLDNPKGMHLNTVRQRGDTILVGGERGLALFSRDGGATFKRLSVPYQGSFFSAELPAADTLVLAGLRGNVWRSTDSGTTWSQLAAPLPVTITASATRADGSLLFANQAGMLLTTRDNALVPLAAAATPLPPLNGLLELDNGSLLTLGVQGVAMLPATAAVARSAP